MKYYLVRFDYNSVFTEKKEGGFEILNRPCYEIVYSTTRLVKSRTEKEAEEKAIEAFKQTVNPFQKIIVLKIETTSEI